MNAIQNCRRSRFIEYKLRLGRDCRQFQCAFLEFKLFPFQEQNRNAAEKEECGWNHGELVARTTVNRRDLRDNRQVDEDKGHQCVKDCCQDRADQKSQGMINTGVAAALEAEAVLNVTLRPREQFSFAGFIVVGFRINGELGHRIVFSYWRETMVTKCWRPVRFPPLLNTPRVEVSGRKEGTAACQTQRVAPAACSS